MNADNGSGRDGGGPPGAGERMVTTYSMWSTFRDCRRRCFWRYIREISPVEPPSDALRIGSLVHAALEVWYREHDAAAALGVVDDARPQGTGDDCMRPWHYAAAMVRNYLRRYAVETFEIVDVEYQFEAPIVNPDTGAQSRSFVMSGKVDGLVRFPDRDGLWILEHKTASTIDGAYLERLWMDFQTTLYAHYVEVTRGERVAGVVYNILAKPGLRQYQAGKTRKVGETNEEFAARLDAWFQAEPQARFHREELLISKDRYTTLQAEIWELTQNLLDARRRNVWYQNTSQCYGIGRGPCPYWPICRGNDNPTVIETLYQPRAAHEELCAATAAETALPF